MPFNSEVMKEELLAWRDLLGGWHVQNDGKWEPVDSKTDDAVWKEMRQEDIGIIVGVHGHTWSRWENGNPVQSPTMLRRALMQYALERGVPVPDYLRREGRARIKLLRDAARLRAAA